MKNVFFVLKRSTIIGAASGSLFAGLAMLYYGGKNMLNQGLGGYFVWTPAYFASKISNSLFFIITVYFTYWIVVGGLFGFLSSLKGSAMLKRMLGLILILTIIHCVAMFKLNKEVIDVVEKLGNPFGLS